MAVYGGDICGLPERYAPAPLVPYRLAGRLHGCRRGNPGLAGNGQHDRAAGVRWRHGPISSTTSSTRRCSSWAIGVIIWKTGENVLSRIGGLQKKMPVTALVYWVAAFSISGVPLFSGYVSQGDGAHGRGTDQHLALAPPRDRLVRHVPLVSEARVFCLPPAGRYRGIGNPPLLMQAAMLGAAGLCIVIGIFPQFLYGQSCPTRPRTQRMRRSTWSVHFSSLAPRRSSSSLSGGRSLSPMKTHLRDIDVVYEGLARGITAGAGLLQALFVKVYSGVIAAAPHPLLRPGSMPWAWKIAMRTGTSRCSGACW